MIVCGVEGGKFATRTFHNDGTGNFNDMDAGLPGLRGHPALGDYNNDGNLDIALKQTESSRNERGTRIYEIT